jgi:hypothetical protein
MILRKFRWMLPDFCNQATFLDRFPLLLDACKKVSRRDGYGTCANLRDPVLRLVRVAGGEKTPLPLRYDFQRNP